MRPSLSRIALPAAILAAGVVAAPASAADLSLNVRVSSPWAVVGFPVTATVTSNITGTVTISQSRVDGLTSTNGGYCGHPMPEILNDLTTLPVTAGKPLKVKIDPSRLTFFGGSLFNPGTGCWDKATAFNKLAAHFAGNNTEGWAYAKFQRVL